MNILFVEDNANTARAMKVMLEMKGHAVDTAETVAQATSRLSAKIYDILISDISLPDGTGYDILSVSGTSIPSIALSGYTLSSVREEAMTKGFSKFLTKPFKVADLMEAIETATRGRTTP